MKKMHIIQKKPLLKWKDIGEWLDWSLSRQLSQKNRIVFNGYYASYKKNFNSYVRKHYVSQTAEVMTLIKSNSRILDIGCGCGTEALWFALQGSEVVGLDLNISRLKVAEERASLLKTAYNYLNVSFQQKNIFDFHSSKKFDIIWLEQTFHHIEPRNELPAKLWRLLKPGGALVFCEVNGWNPILQFLFFKQRGFRTICHFTGQDGQQHAYGNERISTPQAIESLFKRQKFITVGVRYYRMLPNKPSIRGFYFLEGLIPKWVRPVFTHFNMVLIKKCFPKKPRKHEPKDFP